MAKQRKPTSTSSFGVSRREGHDASGFYARFTPPELSDDTTVLPPEQVAEPFQLGDSRNMDSIKPGSVALVVTSPPYFVGKAYEEDIEHEAVPASYLEYLELLEQVFDECKRVLEPGGRIAVNVANLGRKPYRSLSADVITILQDRLGLLLRGEIIWQKGEGASGSCAWGSYRGASNPVIRDITERVIVASKGRFDRALKPEKRRAQGLPHVSDIHAEEFMGQTLDVWSMPTESAKRVQHPAPFPVELPEKLIRLYTYRDDLVLDPFMGSGSTLVAAAQQGRRYVGYDLDPTFVELARQRVAAAAVPTPRPTPIPVPAATSARRRRGAAAPDPVAVAVAVETELADEARAGDHGETTKKLAVAALEAAGFGELKPDHRVPGTGVTVSFRAVDAKGRAWWFDLAGTNTSHRGGLQRSDVVWRALGRANALRAELDRTPLVLLTSHLPKRRSEGDVALRGAGPGAFFDAVELLAPADRDRLAHYAAGGFVKARGGLALPEAGFWTAEDLAARG